MHVEKFFARKLEVSSRGDTPDGLMKAITVQSAAEVSTVGYRLKEKPPPQLGSGRGQTGGQNEAAVTTLVSLRGPA